MKEPEDNVHHLLQHEKFALDLARRLVGDPHGAEDLVQQAWLRALQTPPRENRGLRAWVSRVLVNLARSRYRAIERHRRIEIEAGVSEAAAESGELDAAELRATLDQALERISAIQREAIRLRYYEGLPPRAIARRLDVPLETVYTRLQRGLRELRAVLGPRRAGDLEHRPPRVAAARASARPRPLVASDQAPGWRELPFAQARPEMLSA